MAKNMSAVYWQWTISKGIEEVQNRATQWFWIYNNVHPNMALNGIKPMPKLAAT
jgi:hypothetical protein